MVAVTAILAVGLFVTQYLAGKKSRELASLQAELIRAKDKQLELDLKNKDAGIEEAKERAATANSRAEELKKENLETQKKLEDERLARAEIEERVAFRRIPEKQRSEMASRLKAFARQAASVWFHAGDYEGSVFASDIASALETAGWDVFAPASMMQLAESGRRGSTMMETGITVVSTGHQQSIKASEAIVRELLALGFDARKSPRIEERPVSVVIVNCRS
jgi:outer membrane murein-binding lipoprotein Lpp